MPAFFMPAGLVLANGVMRGASLLGRWATGLSTTVQASLTSRNGLAVGLGVSVSRNLENERDKTSVALGAAFMSVYSRNPVYGMFGLGMAAADWLRARMPEANPDGMDTARIMDGVCAGLRSLETATGKALCACVNGVNRPKLEAKLKSTGISEGILFHAAPFDDKAQLIGFIKKHGGFGMVVNVCDQSGSCCFWSDGSPEDLVRWMAKARMSHVIFLKKSGMSVVPVVVSVDPKS